MVNRRLRKKDLGYSPASLGKILTQAETFAVPLQQKKETEVKLLIEIRL